MGKPAIGFSGLSSGAEGCLVGISGRFSRIHAGFGISYGIMDSLAGLPERKRDPMRTSTTRRDMKGGNAQFYRRQQGQRPILQ
jgi:hypothetical protein